MTHTRPSPTHAAPRPPRASTAFRTVSTIGGVLGLVLLAGCVALAVYSFLDTSSSTAVLGVAVAVVLALPLLLGLGLVLGGRFAHRRSPGAGFGLTLSGAVIIGLVALLVLAQLVLGS